MSSYGHDAVELIRELKRTAPPLVPQYSEDIITRVISEVQDLYSRAVETVNVFQDSEQLQDLRVAGGLTVLYGIMQRNIRCVLAYLNERVARIKVYRWELGAGLPEHARDKLGANEIQFAQQYNALLARYIQTVHLDLTSDLVPPKEPEVTVRVLEEIGEVGLDDGNSINLVHGTQQSMRRIDADLLIRQGKLEHIE